MSYKVMRDGEIKAEFEGFDDAWTCILKSQGQSVDWAVKYEGWNVQMPDGSFVRAMNKTQQEILTKCKAAKNTEPISRNIDLFQLELDDHNDPKNIPNCDRMRTISQYLEVLRIALRERKV